MQLRIEEVFKKKCSYTFQAYFPYLLHQIYVEDMWNICFRPLWVKKKKSVLQDFAIETVKSTHEFWKALISKKTDAGGLNW